jgi:hypothetical protein
MRRLLENNLIEWAKSEEHLPIILRGARQVGKTYLVESFARNHFKHFVSINFELQSEYKKCFDSLNPQEILHEVSLILKQRIISGETLLFLDEIQNCPKAIQALRYFKEQLPALHVIAAGSLLEFTLKDAQFSMPVGRVTFRYLYPMSFKEFLLANQDELLIEALQDTTVSQPLSDNIHEHCLKKLKAYFFLGGMPAVVSQYVQQADWLKIKEYQDILLQSYRADFAKYATIAQRKYLERLFERIPLLISQHFKYSHVDPDMLARDLKVALRLLIDASLITPAYATHASGIPIAAGISEKKFKVFFLDIGLAQQALGITPNFASHIDLTHINQGAMTEQLVAQEFQVYAPEFSPAHLYFWERNKVGSNAEVDFVIPFGQHIIPVEVKSGKTGRLKSLRVFMEEKKSLIGVRVSSLPLSFENQILSVPFYLLSELPRLLEEAID